MPSRDGCANYTIFVIVLLQHTLEDFVNRLDLAIGLRVIRRRELMPEFE